MHLKLIHWNAGTAFLLPENGNAFRSDLPHEVHKNSGSYIIRPATDLVFIRAEITSARIVRIFIRDKKKGRRIVSQRCTVPLFSSAPHRLAIEVKQTEYLVFRGGLVYVNIADVF